ncbi:conserved hypothetical protein [Uncinocarpus reesii 1704]|uniref:Ran GTPase-activating protein 1 n=1 Tax=Uncinocarpus reesii (strain UAMH 1704) TaxID=336963 RepID=C4JHZ5_UNCRE|nr:uncharacterized protein UREG_01420 [Uncinocarpus reesii 1704]EEP76571.1 conserved hypothetical protein [Uncinocarpus reesii 1704]
MAPSSTVFSIQDKGLRFDSAADLEPHIKPLVENDSLFTEIHLGGNTYGVPACELLSKALRVQKKLHTANLADIFTSRLLSEIPQALSFLLNALLEVHTLQTVDLSDNAFGLNTQAPLVEFLQAHLPLRHLLLNNNGLGPKAGTLIADALTELCARKAKARSDPDVGYEVPLLETIVCGRNRLESGSMAAWARAIKDNGKGLRTVKMVQNGIRQDGITLLLDHGLRHAPELEILDMQDNTFTAIGARVLADTVTGWPSLRELSLGDCYLKGRGWLRVGKAIAQGNNAKIEILRLMYNDINAAGLKVLVHAAKNALPILRRVELNGNKFEEDDESIVELRELLDERKEAIGRDDEDEDAWGLDELDELEEESEEEDEEESEIEDVEKRAERIVEEAELAEDEKVAQDLDNAVDALGEKLKGTSI